MSENKANEKKKMSREEYLYHNTEILLKKYRDVVWSVEVSAIGDILYAYIMLFFYGITPVSLLLFTFFTITGGLILTSMSIIFSSLSFWFGKVDALSDTMNNMMIMH